jgi:hypothetical protein
MPLHFELLQLLPVQECRPLPRSDGWQSAVSARSSRTQIPEREYQREPHSGLTQIDLTRIWLTAFCGRVKACILWPLTRMDPNNFSTSETFPKAAHQKVTFGGFREERLASHQKAETRGSE